jgi:hypothetical protein
LTELVRIIYPHTFVFFTARTYKHPIDVTPSPSFFRFRKIAKLFASTFRRTLRSSVGLSIAAAATTFTKNPSKPVVEQGARNMHSKVVGMFFFLLLELKKEEFWEQTKD